MEVYPPKQICRPLAVSVGRLLAKHFKEMCMEHGKAGNLSKRAQEYLNKYDYERVVEEVHIRMTDNRDFLYFNPIIFLVLIQSLNADPFGYILNPIHMYTEAKLQRVGQ